uniref:Galectin n=1 Tax=Meloidogyne floridensis TaxID=298350 RepID=A0A915NFI5_9BILA
MNKNRYSEILTEGNGGELNILSNFNKKYSLKIEFEINGKLNDEDKLYLKHSTIPAFRYNKDLFSLCRKRIFNNDRIYTQNDIQIIEDKKIIYLNEKVDDGYKFGLDICLETETERQALVKIRPIFDGLIVMNIRDKNENYLNSKNIKEHINFHGFLIAEDGDMIIVKGRYYGYEFIYRNELKPMFELKREKKIFFGNFE